jgi:hypothetical protein
MGPFRNWYYQPPVNHYHYPATDALEERIAKLEAKEKESADVQVPPSNRPTNLTVQVPGMDAVVKRIGDVKQDTISMRMDIDMARGHINTIKYDVDKIAHAVNRPSKPPPGLMHVVILLFIITCLLGTLVALELGVMG